MDVGSTYALVSAVLTFGLKTPINLKPEKRCNCGCGQGRSGPAMSVTDEERWLTHLDEHERLRHIETNCRYVAGVRNRTHDAVTALFFTMLAAAGFTDLEEEVRWWDANPKRAAKRGRKRPDIVGRHPQTRQRWVFDVTIAWKYYGNLALQFVPSGDIATEKEHWKVQEYSTAMKEHREDVAERRAKGQKPLEHDGEDKFVPLGFEANGAWGENTQRVFRELVEMADRAKNKDLYHWSAGAWGEHWKHRIGQVIECGRAECVTQVTSKPRRSKQPGNVAATGEWDQSSVV